MKRERAFIERARRLRKGQTEAERKLWTLLANRQTADAKFRRQHPIGPYIVDFACLEHRLVIEVDGGHHNERLSAGADKARTAFLENSRYRVLRFWNNEVEGNAEGVFQRIREVLGTE